MKALVCMSINTFVGPARRVRSVVRFGAYPSFRADAELEQILELDLEPAEAAAYVVGESYELALTRSK